MAKETLNESLDKNYRRIRDELERYHDVNVNDKRIFLIFQNLVIKPTIKYTNDSCASQAANPPYITKSILNREFIADAPTKNISQI